MMCMRENIIFKEENEKLFFQYWSTMVEVCKVGPRYLPLNLEVNLALARYRSVLIADKSFIYMKNNNPVAGVFLPIEENNGLPTISVANYYVDAPLFLDRSVEKSVFTTIDELARENTVVKIMLSVDPLERDVNYNYLQKYNYLDTSILNYVIDLKMQDLFSYLRRNHRRSIKWIAEDQDFSVFVIDSTKPSYDHHEEFRTLHHKCAGRVTAPKEAFDLQFEKLKQGHTVLFGLRYKEKNIAYMYFDYNEDKAISYQAADDPDYNQLPLYHILTFTAMEYLQKRGVKHIDTGQPSGPSHQIDYYPDVKQLNIGLFKYGFGGGFRSQFRGIKYFSKAALGKDIENFLDSYKA